MTPLDPEKRAAAADESDASAAFRPSKSAAAEAEAGEAQRRDAAAATALLAALLMFGAIICFCAMAVLIRLASSELHSLQIVFLRNFFALLIFAPILMRDGIGLLRSPQLNLHLWRGANGLIAMTAYFTALSLAPLAEVTALNFTTPLFATLLAVLLLGEVIRWRRIAALLAGFAGVMLVLGENLGAPSLGAGLAIVAAFFMAVAIILVKRLTRTDTPLQISIWMVVAQTPLALIPALFVWSAPSWTALGLLGLVAALGSVGHLMFTKAAGLAEVSQLQPIEFAKLPILAAAGWIVFSEAPSLNTWIGGGVIFAATSYVTWRETRVTRSRRAAAAAAGGAIHRDGAPAQR